MSWVAVAVGGASLIGSVYSSNKASKTADKAIAAGQVDIDAISQMASDQAKQNAYASAELERQLTPEVPQLRTASNQAVLAGLQTPADVTKARAALAAQTGQNLNTPLLNAAIQKAQSDLALGGNLDVDTQNAVTRAGLAKTGAATGGLGLGRDVVARDLGLTSLQLQQQRLNAASQIGGQELDLAQSNSTNLLNNVSMLSQLQNAERANALNVATYGQSIGMPVVGLDPAGVANLATGNATNASAGYANKANIAGAQGQSYMNLAGQGLGYGLMAYNNRQPAQTSANQQFASQSLF